MKVQFSFAREHYIGARRYQAGDAAVMDADLAETLAAAGVGTCGDAVAPAVAAEPEPAEQATPRKRGKRKHWAGASKSE